jgi:Flp pilus assembly protein TadG
MDKIKISIIIPLLKKFKKDDSGAVLILVAVTLALVLVFVALALDVGYAWVKTRNMQAVADAAAYSGAAGIVARYNPPASSLITNMYTDDIYAVASASGFVSGSNGDTVTPLLTTAGTIAGHLCSSTSMCVTVSISELHNFGFIGAVQKLYNLTDKTGNLTYSVKATAQIQVKNQYCIIALSSAGDCAFQTTGNVNIDSPGCGVAVNSTVSNAMCCNGSVSITAPVNVAGGLSGGCAITPNPTLYGSPVIDPFAQNSVLQTALNTPFSGSDTDCPSGSLSPGNYGKLSVKNKTCTLSGVYYLNDLKVGANGNLQGDNVTLILSSNGPASSVAANSSINMTAPTSGPFQGISIASLNNKGISIQGTPYMSLSGGTIYLPKGNYDLGGTPSNQCVRIVAGTFSSNGNVSINNINDTCFPPASLYHDYRIQLIE